MTKRVIFALQKGGVGKTSGTVAVAEILAATGNRVLVVDFDSQGNATKISAEGGGNRMKETVQQRLERMKRDQEAMKANESSAAIIDQLTHESDGDQDFREIAKKLRERKEAESKGENEGYKKMTIYIREDIAASFNALTTKRGQQKEFANIAFADFVAKKARELGLK